MRKVRTTLRRALSPGAFIDGSIPCALRVLVAAFIGLGIVSARADEDDAPQNVQRPQNRSPVVNAGQAIGADEIEGPTIFESVPALNGIDHALDTLRDRYGFYFYGEYIGDPYGNLRGGLKRGFTYSGRLDVELSVQAAKIGLPAGGTFHANLFQTHGGDLSRDDIGNFLSSNDIAANPGTRLYELWYEQKFGDALSIRLGQQGLDVEFLTSSYAASFVDATFGWPGLPSENLPDGGAAYPLAAPAVRVRFEPTKDVAVLAAVFDGAPAGPCTGEPQDCDPHGVNFRVTDPPLAILEAQVRYNEGAGASGLPGRVKLGAFEQFGRFNDARYGADDLNTTLGLNSILHAPTGGLYGVVDQQVYRLPGDTAVDDDQTDDDDKVARGVGVFVRVIGAPSTRNPVDFYMDCGISALGLVPGRPNDLFGAAVAVAKISGPTVGLMPDALAPGAGLPRTAEAVLEATYQAEVVAGFTLQPTFQYIVSPSGNVANPYSSVGAPIRSAVVAGVTTTVRF